MPDDLTGKPDVVIKDPLGKILYVDYKKDCEPVNTTTYECDNCFKEFTVKAQITLTAEPVSEEKDFSTEYTSLI